MLLSGAQGTNITFLAHLQPNRLTGCTPGERGDTTGKIPVVSWRAPMATGGRVCLEEVGGVGVYGM